MEKNENSTFKDVFRKYVWGWLCPVIVVFIIVIVQELMVIPVEMAAAKRQKHLTAHNILPFDSKNPLGTKGALLYHPDINCDFAKERQNVQRSA